jgi:hypothetical protein
MPVLPDPRLEAPGLLYPGRKPAGPVAIDSDHPLAKGLEAVFIVGGNDTPIDLTGNGYIWSNETSGGADYSIGKQGGQLLHTAGDDMSIITPCPLNSIWSVVVGQVVFGVSGDFPVVISSDTLSLIRGNYLQVVFCELDFGGDLLLKDTSNASRGDFIVNVGVSVDGAGKVDFTQNGFHHGELAGATEYDYSGETLLRIGNRAAQNRQWNQNIPFIYFYNRALSATEQILISRDPYSFLIPD